MKLKANKGQALPYLIAMIMVLVISWGMVMNIAKVLTDRMLLQNAADNAALSIAVNQARALNTIAKLNQLIALSYLNTYPIDFGIANGLGGVHPATVPLRSLFPAGIGNFVKNFDVAGVSLMHAPYCATIPLAWQIFENNATKIMSYGDIIGNDLCWGFRYGHKKKDFFVKSIKTEVDTFIDAQTLIAEVTPGLGSMAAKEIAKKHFPASERGSIGYEITTPEFAIAEELAGIPAGGAQRSREQHLLRHGLKRNEIKIEYFGAEHYFGTVTFFGVWHFHAVVPYKIADNKYGNTYKAWYLIDPKVFHRKKYVVKLQKKQNGDFKPFFSRLFDIKFPGISVVSAASIYNTANYEYGPGFVIKEDNKDARLHETVRAYNSSKNGGWYAHQVPVDMNGITQIKH